MKAIIAYVPALHKGYRDLFVKYAKEARTLFVISREIIAEIDHLRKDLRALEPELAAEAIKGWKLFEDIQVLDREWISALKKMSVEIIMPDEEISRHIATKYFGDHRVKYDTVFFLRWDPEKALVQKVPDADHRISADIFDREIMQRAFLEGGKSSDWWRRIGALLVKDGEMLIAAHNHGVPSEHTVYITGDPRSNFKKGLNIEISVFAHAEATVIAEAARRGISTDGASLYVTTFPCPPCAKLIAQAGVKKLYYSVGYAILDGDKDLRDAGTEIVFVNL